MHTQFDIRPLITRRSVAATALFTAAVAIVATTPSLFGHKLSSAWDGLESAQPIWLWTAACCFIASLITTSWAWRSALGLCGGRLSRPDAAARYSIGSLVNGLSPVRLGEPVRVALFARSLDGNDRGWRMGGVFGVITAVRCVIFTLIVVTAAALGALPFWPIALLCGLIAVASVTVLGARGRAPRGHVAHLLDAFRSFAHTPHEGLRIGAWIVAATTARFAGAAAVATALGVHSPVTAALVIMPALDLAGLIPLTGNLGVTSGAIAVVLQTHGVGGPQAIAAGLAFHAVETAAGITFGLAGALLLAPRHRLLKLAAAGATACLVAAFCATVLLPLA